MCSALPCSFCALLSIDGSSATSNLNSLSLPNLAFESSSLSGLLSGGDWSGWAHAIRGASRSVRRASGGVETIWGCLPSSCLSPTVSSSPFGSTPSSAPCCGVSGRGPRTTRKHARQLPILCAESNILHVRRAPYPPPIPVASALRAVCHHTTSTRKFVLFYLREGKIVLAATQNRRGPRPWEACRDTTRAGSAQR